jgi:hypothetical protein
MAGIDSKQLQAALCTLVFKELITDTGRRVGKGGTLQVFELLLQEIEHRYCSMQSMLYAGIGLGVTEAYKKAVRKAFQDIFNEANNTKDVH